MINIVTSICVDTSLEESASKYPQLGNPSAKERRKLYWKLATTFSFSSLRCNPQNRHIIFTNDEAPVKIGRIDLKEELQKRGIEIQILPFETFVPPSGSSKTFRNAFYKLDVIKALGEIENSSSILLDSDCLWTQPNEELKSIISCGKILLYDPFNRIDPFQREPAGLSRADIGKLYSSIDPDYPEPYPIWYGGELIAGRHNKLKKIAEELESFFHIVTKMAKENALLFSNGQSIFDGDEFISTYVYNKQSYNEQGVEIVEAGAYLKRIWTAYHLNTIEAPDINIPIWHLPSEKTSGLQQVFNEAIRDSSEFWRVPLQDFNRYLGEYVGVPEKKRYTWSQWLSRKFPVVRQIRKKLFRFRLLN